MSPSTPSRPTRATCTPSSAPTAGPKPSSAPAPWAYSHPPPSPLVDGSIQPLPTLDFRAEIGRESECHKPVPTDCGRCVDQEFGIRVVGRLRPAQQGVASCFSSWSGGRRLLQGFSRSVRRRPTPPHLGRGDTYDPRNGRLFMR